MSALLTIATTLAMSGDAPSARLPDGLQVRHDMLGFYVLTDEEAEHEDDGNNSVGFDGRPHYASIRAAEKAAATMAYHNLSPDEWSALPAAQQAEMTREMDMGEHPANATAPGVMDEVRDELQAIDANLTVIHDQPQARVADSLARVRALLTKIGGAS